MMGPKGDEVATIDQLRLFIDERIPPGGSDADTGFLDADLQMLLDNNQGNLYGAAADGWAIKAGFYHALIDINENGSDRKMSQMYDHAEKRAKYFLESYNKELTAAGSPRVAGIGVDVWEVDDTAGQISIFSSNYGNIRTYPLYRFPAVLS